MYGSSIHISQKLTININSQAVSSTDYAENWEEKYSTSRFLDDFYCSGNFRMVMFINIPKNWVVVDNTIQKISQGL